MTVSVTQYPVLFQPALVAMKKKGLEAIHQLECSKLREESSLEQYNEQINEVREEIAQLEKDIKGKDEELECRKQVRAVSSCFGTFPLLFDLL